MIVCGAMTRILLACSIAVVGCATAPAAPPAAPSAAAAPEPAFEPLFNGKDLAGWRIPEGDNGHWKVVDGVIDYDARSEAPGSKDLWTEREFGDFVLRLDWRIKETPATHPTPEVLPDGSTRKDANGKEVLTDMPNADSGVFGRGASKAQINIWC